MDMFGSKNIRLVLIAVIGWTTLALGVLLWRVANGDAVPDLLLGLTTTLLGLVTGSTVSLGAPPRVDAAAKAATDAVSETGYQVREAAALPVAVPLEHVLSGGPDYIGSSVPEPEAYTGTAPEPVAHEV